jgi:hypothetical protein
MFEQLPKQVELVYDWTWDSYQPFLMISLPVS